MVYGSLFETEVSKGNVRDYSYISKFGENPSLDIADGFVELWDGSTSYVPPTEARIHNVVSTDAADVGTLLSSGTATGGSVTSVEDTGATFVTDGVSIGNMVLNDDDLQFGIITAVTETVLTIGNGMREARSLQLGLTTEGKSYRVVTNGSTGASVFYVQGLDASWNEQDEFVILNGVTPVATVNSFIRQYRARVLGPNASESAGAVTSTAQTDGTISCQVIAGINQSLMSIYTVPTGKTGYLHRWWGSISKKQAAASNLRLRIGHLDGFGYVSQSRGIDSQGSSEFDYKWEFPIPVPSGVDVWIEADTDTNATSVAGGFDITLIASD